MLTDDRENDWLANDRKRAVETHPKHFELLKVSEKKDRLTISGFSEFFIYYQLVLYQIQYKTTSIQMLLNVQKNSV